MTFNDLSHLEHSQKVYKLDVYKEWKANKDIFWECFMCNKSQLTCCPISYNVSWFILME